jgi:hypothetical protein
MILKASGIFRCTPGFADEAIDISPEHGVDLPLAGIRIETFLLKSPRHFHGKLNEIFFQTGGAGAYDLAGWPRIL